jgi:hypothetical protein
VLADLASQDVPVDVPDHVGLARGAARAGVVVFGGSILENRHISLHKRSLFGVKQEQAFALRLREA